MKSKCIAVGIAILAFALPATASAQSGWTWNRASAEESFMSEYETVDPWALQDACRTQTLGVPCYPREVAAAKRAAYPVWVHCRGVGAHRGDTYGRFWCRTHLESWKTDYEATKQITLIPTGRYTFRVLNGSH